MQSVSPRACAINDTTLRDGLRVHAGRVKRPVTRLELLALAGVAGGLPQT